jgi:branched-chain amino acid aminotransferase
MDEHLERLWRSANKIDMPISFTKSKIIAEVKKTLKELDVKRAYIRIVVTRGEGEITLDPHAANQNNLVIITKELNENPRWWYDDGVEIIIADIKRTSSESMDPAVKSGNYLNNILAYNEAVKQGAFDAVMLNHDGFVTEGTTSNIWMIKETKLITPPLKAGLLGGITRAKIIELCKNENITIEEKNITADELRDADEVFLTSSTKRIVPIVKIDQKVIGAGKPGSQTLSILQKYLNLI